MSAIFGILRFDGGEVSSRDLERMANTLAHRGPDGRKFIADGPIGLGHCLMRVNNEDLFEAQPLYDREADLTLVADLRLDNRDELADIFGIDAADLRDMPDSALVMRAYKKWGEDCAEHLLGDFAFAIWDGHTRKLLLGRDHMGQRYVHYHRSQDFFCFATEIKALWAIPDVPRELNEQQLGRFLLMDLYPRKGQTLFKEVYGLSGGTALTVRPDGALSNKQYWEPQAAAEHLGRDENYYVENYRRVLAEAVNCRIRRLIAPPALCLSAGYDSAAIAGLCGQLLTAQGRKLITISSVLPENYSGPCRDVRPWAEFCRRDMPHLDVRYFVRGMDALETGLQAACRTADQVPPSAGYILDGLFGTAAGAGCHLIMDGMGGDSTLNPRDGAALAYFLRSGKLLRFLSELRAHKRMTGQSHWRTLRSNVGLPLAPAWMRRIWLDFRKFGPRQMRRFVAPEFLHALQDADAVNASDLPSLRNSIAMRSINARMLRHAAGLPRGHHTNEAAAYGLDLTRPMMDKRTVELGLAIPEDFYVVNGRYRHLACRALSDVYPIEYQSRKHRQDPFDPDFAGTMQHALPQMRADLKRMEASRVLRKHLDLDAMADACSETREKEIDAAEMTVALRVLNTARYLDWFRGENR